MGSLKKGLQIRARLHRLSESIPGLLKSLKIPPQDEKIKKDVQAGESQGGGLFILF